MARDDLFFHLFGHVSSRFGTPIRAQWLCGLIAALLACVPVDRLALFLSIGVLLSYTIVCAGVLVLRADSPQKAAKCSGLVSLGDIRPPEAFKRDTRHRFRRSGPWRRCSHRLALPTCSDPGCFGVWELEYLECCSASENHRKAHPHHQDLDEQIRFLDCDIGSGLVTG